MAEGNSPGGALPKSDYFELAEVGEGIWAAIARDWDWTVGNAAIVDLGGRVLVVDTFISARAATELREAARRLTGRETAWVVNTHFHNDHTGGNEIFEAACIAAADGTRETVLERAARLPERLEEARAELARAEAAVAAGDTSAEARRREVATAIERVSAMRVVAPDVAFSDRLTLFGERRRAEVVAVGAAHTPSDCVVYLPDDKVLVAGDVVLVRSHPWVGDGDVRNWVPVLGRLAGMGAERVIPGHGEVGTPGDISDMADYMGELLGLADAAVASAAPGTPPESLPLPPIPERWRAWGWEEGWPDNFPFFLRAAALA